MKIVLRGSVRMVERRRRFVSTEDQLKEKIVEIGEVLGELGYVSSLGSYAPGNISAKLARTRLVLITPSGLAKNALDKRMICTITLEGRVVRGRLKPTSETPTHLAIYKNRPDVNAIVHSHPPYATAFSVARTSIPVVTIEMAGLLGCNVPVAGFAIPGTKRLATKVVRCLKNSSAVLLQNHGLVVVGSTLDEAVSATMAIEENARLLYYASIIGRPRTIPRKDTMKIRNKIQTEYGQRKNLQSTLK